VNIGTLKEGFVMDSVYRNWWLPPQGAIGRPIISPLPSWVGTTLYGTPETKGHAEIHNELRAIGLIA
jgi:hypothetical protein